jgi:hypothetical protein
MSGKLAYSEWLEVLFRLGKVQKNAFASSDAIWCRGGGGGNEARVRHTKRFYTKRRAAPIPAAGSR